MWDALAYILCGIAFTIFFVIKVRRKGKLSTIIVSDVAALLGVALFWPFAAAAIVWWEIKDVVIVGGKDD